MTSYVETIIGPGEHVIHVGRVSLLSVLPGLLGGAILVIIGVGLIVAPTSSPDMLHIVGAGAALLGVLFIAAALIRRSSTELAVTNRRVIAKFGLVSRSTIEMNLAKIESVRVDQSVLGRLFGFGSIIVVGTGSSMDPIRFIADPIPFRQAIQAATDALPRT